jgi:hypothetical protein
VIAALGVTICEHTITRVVDKEQELQFIFESRLSRDSFKAQCLVTYSSIYNIYNIYNLII